MRQSGDIQDYAGACISVCGNAVAGAGAGSFPHCARGRDGYDDLPQSPKRRVSPFRRTIRRAEFRQIVPLAEATFYEMERLGEFRRRINLTPRCVVWNLA